MKKEIEGQVRALQTLFEAGQELNAAIDLDDLMVKILEEAKKICDVEASSLLLLDPEGKELFFKIALGGKGEEVKNLSLPVKEGIAGWVAIHAEPLMINDVNVDPRFSGRFDKQSGFQTRSILCVPILGEGKVLGVVEAINKRGEGKFLKDDQENLTIFAQQASIALHNSRVINELHNFFTNVIEILVEAIEALDPASKGHLLRVARLATAIGREMELRKEEYRNLYYASIIHDIGKLKRSDVDIERLHPLLGAEMLTSITMLKGAAQLIKFHHERSDGSGYPQGLKGEDIPLAARILALAEAYDGNFSEDTSTFLEKASTHFGQEVADAFKRVIDEGILESIYGI